MYSVKQSLGEVLAQPVKEVAQDLLFDSLITVQQARNLTDALGQVDYTNTGFANIAGVVDVPCMRSPASQARIIGGQTDTPTQMESFNLYHVLLQGYFPQIPEPVQGRGELRAIIDGVQHEVLAVEKSSQLATANQTRLQVRQVAV
jgi:hypothetical protein